MDFLSKVSRTIKKDKSDELNDHIPVSEDPPGDSDHPEYDEDDDEYIVDHTTTKLTETTHHLNSKHEVNATRRKNIINIWRTC